MNCREMDAILFSGGDLSAEAREHLAHCPNCRALAEALSAPSSGAVDAAALERARTQIPQLLEPVKPLEPAGTYAAGFLLVAAAIGAGAASLVGLYGLHVLAPWQGAAVFAVLLASLALAAFAAAGDMRPGARTLPGTLTFGVAFGGAEVVFLTLFSDYRMGRFANQGITCFRFGMMVAVVTALLVWLAARRGYIVAPISTGAALGALSGLAGLTMLELHCPILHVPHLIVWHAAVLVASAALGAAAGWAARLKPA